MDRKPEDEMAMTLCGTDGEGRVSLLGTVLAEGARLISEGKVSEAVQRSQPGAFALCRLSKEGDEVLELRAPFEVTVGRAASISKGTWHVADKWMSKAHFRVMATSEDVMEIEDLEIFENVAYIMAFHADPSIPGTIDEWLEQFEMFSIYEILPEILDLWGTNLITDVQSKKNSKRAAVK